MRRDTRLGRVLAWRERRALEHERHIGLCLPIPDYDHFFVFRNETGQVKILTVAAGRCRA